ncbi:hypothetical protein TWF694_011134 [Orbilia ellipsospora]|uniref:F-box domain-containing protein n=1 Tax=Orbilia ellipsospora TaxID=2528407 RepID=A0AAV9X844_9PEZI
MVTTTVQSLSALPYDILIHICDQLDEIRKEGCKPRTGRPPIPTHPTHYTYFTQIPEQLTPKTPHDSPRRAEQWRIDELILNPKGDRNTENGPGVFVGASIFDGLSRTNKHLREICYPYLFRNVVLASDDCLTIDRLEFYSKANWVFKYIRSLRFSATNLTWPNSLGANTPKHLLPSAISNAVSILTSIPNLQILHFAVEPSDIIHGFKTAFISTPPKTPSDNYTKPNDEVETYLFTFPHVKDLYIISGMEWLIPLCGTVSGLEVFEYETSGDPGGIRAPNRMGFRTLNLRESEDSPPDNRMLDERAVGVLRGLEKVKRDKLWKFTLSAFVHNSGIEQLAPFLQNVTELYLMYGIASLCASSLRFLPSLIKVRFGRDEEPIRFKNPHCYMSRRELLMVARHAKLVEEIWYRDRFVCYVKRTGVEGGLLEVDEEGTWWRDTWADDGIGKREVISSGWLG